MKAAEVPAYTLPEPTEARTDQSRTLTACIFDVDGVLLASPHEQAWREALVGLVEPSRFTTEMYQAQVAGKPRLAGARSALDALGVKDAAGQTAGYGMHKLTRGKGRRNFVHECSRGSAQGPRIRS